MSQKFCHECGCNIANFLGDSGASSFGSSNNFNSNNTNNNSNSFDSFGSFGSFDFSSIETAAKTQLNAEKEKENFYRNAEIKGTTLVKYKGDEEEVNIPEGITAIANSAFYSASAKTIRIPKTARIFA